MQRRILLASGLAIVVMATSGCGSAPKDAPKLAPVAGVLKYKGAPIPDVSLTFYPAKGPAGTGLTDAKGAFQIKTNGQLGAAVGKHKVTASLPQQSGTIPPADGNEIALIKIATIPAKYSDQSTTDLSLDIAVGGNKEVVLDLTD